MSIQPQTMTMGAQHSTPVWHAYDEKPITPEMIEEYFGAEVSAGVAIKLANDFGGGEVGRSGISALASVIAPQLERCGYSDAVITELFHGEPRDENQTIAHRHREIGVGPFAE